MSNSSRAICEAPFDAAQAEGKAMSVERAIAFALD